MTVALRLSAFFVGFVAFSGYLFGQLFFGDFSVVATLSGVSGVICAAFALRMSSQPSWAPARVYVACFIALAGVAMNTIIHYTQFDTPGNYYAWHIFGPYAACILLVALAANRRRASRRPDV